MFSTITSVNTRIWKKIEDSLTPLPSHSKNWRIWHHLSGTACIPIGIATLLLDLIGRVIAYVFRFFSKDKRDPKKDFTAILDDSRKWNEIQSLDVKFDPQFLFGTATCTFQDSGAVNCPNSQWSMWEKKCVAENNQSGKSANLFELYQTSEGRKAITNRLHQLGANTYRFSIEWSHIEPEPGKFDETKIQIYINFLKYLRDEGITPIVTLHHFSEPLWFHKLESFKKEENIKYYLAFVEKIFPYLAQDYKGKPLVEYICTINEPNIEAFSRYIRGAFSPGEFLKFSKAGHFLKNALKAHCLAYEMFKKMNPKVQVGFVHQRLSLVATNPFIGVVVRYINHLVNETVLNFFKMKKFVYKIPFCCHIVDDSMQPKADFVGLQYYTRPIIGFTGSTSYHESMTIMPFREDPEGLYEAGLEVFNAFKTRVIVTENGISTRDDEQRKRYLERALYALKRLQEKIGKENLFGYCLWSFCDNSEWDMGRYPQAFGAYQLYSDGELALAPKKGLEPFMQAAAASSTTAEEKAS